MTPFDTLIDDVEDQTATSVVKAVQAGPRGYGYGGGGDAEVLFLVTVPARAPWAPSAPVASYPVDVVTVGTVEVQRVDLARYLAMAAERQAQAWARLRLGRAVRTHPAFDVVEDYVVRAYPPPVLASALNARAHSVLSAWGRSPTVGRLAPALVYQALAELYRRGPWTAADLPAPTADDLAPALHRAGLLTDGAVSEAHLLLEAHRSGRRAGPFPGPLLGPELGALNADTSRALGRGRSPLFDPTPRAVHDLFMDAYAGA